ncbi:MULTISPECIES: PAS domain S-box protein [Haloarcula]|uniref:PAS domain S-box protein n=1 Tax=Haloarcula TaxID=2237 RepID=UPI0023EB3F94|nr:PAS domain S-box protein [Halomicroarcula sp. XH51]
MARLFGVRGERLSRSTGVTGKRWRWLGGLVLLVPGIAVGIATVVQLFNSEAPARWRLVTGAALFCLSLPLVVGAAWLATSDYEPADVKRVVSWSLAGSLPITALALVVVGYQQAHGVSVAQPLLVTAWVAGTGAVGGLLTGVYDVSRERERVRSTRAENRLSAIVEASPVAVIAIDSDGIVQTWSSGAERLFGWTAGEVLGEPYPLVPEDRREEFRRHKQRVDKGYVIDGIETQRQRKDGALVDVSLWSAPINDPDESVSGHMIAIADVTDRKQREQQLAVLERVLRHDIRNTVNVIEGRGDLLLRELDDEANLSAASRIVERARRLERLSEKARDVTNVLRGGENAGVVDVVDLVREQRRRIGREYPDCDIRLDAPSSATVSGDQRLGIAIREAVENAVVHGYRETPDGEPAYVSLEVRHEDEYVVVTVTDTGPGIPERERKPLSAETETSLQHGSGIGLWSIHWLVRSIGGEVTISDRDPHGAVVTLQLPEAPESLLIPDSRRTD